MLQGVTLGQDSWANDCRMKIREGLRSMNMLDFGELRIWIVDNRVILTDDDNQNAVAIPCESKAAAIIEATRIGDELLLGARLVDIIQIDDVPEKLLSARIS